MAKVVVLPEYIASQIAAGEVVERPSSVVKELVENSIDSGASKVEIAVGADCRDIRVADNGQGMDAEDAVLAFNRHATSKLKSADDLWSLNSLGFRGEALPSISSVAKVTCLTRTAGAASGSRVEALEGKITATETGCAPGTVMEITELFYNVPARMKFLKKASTEFAHIQETVLSLAIAYPEVAFTLIDEGEVVLRTTGSADLRKAILETGFFKEYDSLIEIENKDSHSGMHIYGFMGRPTSFRGDRKGILSFVNDRPVRCPLTYKALDYAYSDLIPRGRYPLAVIKVDVPKNCVDINIHPTKKEIKYSNGNDVYFFIQRSLVETMRKQAPSAGSHAAGELARSAQSILPAQTPVYENGEDLPTMGESPVVAISTFVTEYGDKTEGIIHPGSSGIVAETPSAKPRQLGFREQLSYVPPAAAEPANALPADWKVIGYLLNTYILIQSEKGLEIVEQHIAHERTLYERYLQEHQPGRICEHSQRLLMPQPVNLTAEQRSVIPERLEVLKELGFDFVIEDGNLACIQIPLELAEKDYATAVQDIVEQIATTDSADLRLEAVKSLACQSAIKNGMPLCDGDIAKLLSDWHNTPRNDTCPHGRPVRLQFSKDKLFQLFHPA